MQRGGWADLKTFQFKFLNQINLKKIYIGAIKIKTGAKNCRNSELTPLTTAENNYLAGLRPKKNRK